MDDEPVRAVGVVPVEGRGSLPFTLNASRGPFVANVRPALIARSQLA